MQTWRQTLYNTIADGTAVTAAAETILVPDYTMPAGFLYPGALLKYTLFGRMSSATTPGTFTWRLRWGGVGGTSLAASAALTPDVTATQTNTAWWAEFYVCCRSVGTAGTAMSWGRCMFNDLEDATSATLAAQLGGQMLAFPDAAAAVTIDTTTAKALSPTITPSLGTGSVQCHHALLESLS
jgi:hypothetical protein